MQRWRVLAVVSALALGCDERTRPLRVTRLPDALRVAEYEVIFEHGRPIPLLLPEGLEAVDPRSSAPFPTTVLHWSFDRADDGWLTNLADARAHPYAGELVPGPVGSALVPGPGGLLHPMPEHLRGEWSLFARFELVGAEGHVLSIGEAVDLHSTASGVRVSAAGAVHEFALQPGWHWLGVTFEHFGHARRAGVLLCTASEQRRLELPVLPEVPRGRPILLAEGVALDEFRIERGPLSTLAHMRLDDPPRPPVRRTARFCGPGVDETVEVWSTRSTDLDLAGSELGRLAALDHLLATDDGLTWTSAQWRQHDTDLGPRPRTTHPTVALGEGQVWIFGGETKDSHVWPQWNDAQVWIYDALRYSWRRVPEHEGWPHARAHLPASYWRARGVVWFRGGWFNSEGTAQRSFQDVWCFDATADRFTRWDVPDLPTLSDMALVTALDAPSGSLLLGSYNEAFDLEARQIYRRVKASAFDVDGAPLEWPQVVSSAHALDPTRNRVVLFGGESGQEPKQFHATTFSYEPVENEIRVLTRQGPPARSRPGFARDAKRDRFVLFGGVQGQRSQRFDDLWTFDPATDTWREVVSADPPSPRGGYFGMAYDETTDAFYVVHGRHSTDIFLDEVWQLTLRDEAIASASWCFSSDDWSPTGTAWVAGDWRPGDAVELTLATSSDGLRFTPLSGPPSGASFVRLTATLTAGDPHHPPRITRAGLGAAEPLDLGPEVARLRW